MSEAIDKLYWDIASGSEYSQTYVLFPSPLDFDNCFQKSGFTEFKDSDEEWHSDWMQCIDEVYRSLVDTFGEPSKEKLTEYKQASLMQILKEKIFKTPKPSKATEALYLSSIDDSFGQSSIFFSGDSVLQSFPRMIATS